MEGAERITTEARCPRTLPISNGMTIKENVLLAPHTTFKVGGPARYFVDVTTENEVKEAVLFARNQNVPFFILGGGSNILVSDKGFPGLVIKNSLRGITYEKFSNNILVKVSAGESWDSFVSHAVSSGWYGIENLSGIPGTVGAAPIQNIGAYGVEVGKIIDSVAVLNTITGKAQVFSNEECKFEYRNSFFKSTNGKQHTILTVTFRLCLTPTPIFSYAEVVEYFKNTSVNNKTLSAQDIRRAILDVRKNKLPPLELYGTASSFFKNPVITKKESIILKKRYPDLPVYGNDKDMAKVSAGYLIDKVCGLKGFVLGKARVYEKQGLVLVAENNATASEIYALAERVKNDVFVMTRIQLEMEVIPIGEF